MPQSNISKLINSMANAVGKHAVIAVPVSILDTTFERDGVMYRVSASTDTFIIATRVGAPDETDDPDDIIKVMR